MANQLPPSLMANLQSVLLSRNRSEADSQLGPLLGAEAASDSENQKSKPIVLVTNGEGIRSPGLGFLVEALVREAICDVHACAPDLDKCSCGHSITVHETISATSFDEFTGATAFSVSAGSPVDCVSLALSGLLFSWSKPALVICGVERGSNYGHDIFYSGAIGAAREALVYGVPSLAISFNWKKGENQESDLKDAVEICMPLINAAIKDIQNGNFPKNTFLNIKIPSSPLNNKGFKITRQSKLKRSKSWTVVPTNRIIPNSARKIMSHHYSLGIQLAQLGKEASAPGAKRRIAAQRQDVEVVESVVASGNPAPKEVINRLFRLEFVEKQQEDLDEDADWRASENGYICVTPLNMALIDEISTSVSDWISAALVGEKETS